MPVYFEIVVDSPWKKPGFPQPIAYLGKLD